MKKTYILCLLGALLSLCPVAGYGLTVIINNSGPGFEAAGSLRLTSAFPYEKQEFTKSPDTVTLTFSQPVKPDKSYIRVYDLYGNQLPVGDMQSKNLTLSVSLPELTPGKYSVKWKARCRCDADDEISDNFHFTVK